MPLQNVCLPDNHLLWHIEEDPSFFERALQLSEQEIEQIHQKYKHAGNRLHWMVSRYLLQELLSVDYRSFRRNAQRKLFLENRPQLSFSLSHSGTKVIVVQAAKAVGVDIQQHSTKLQRIAQKFISTQDLEVLRQSDAYIDYIHLYWGIKEALFKAYSLGGLDYRKQLFIDLFSLENTGKTLAYILVNETKLSYSVNYLIIRGEKKEQDYYLCTVTLLD